MWCLYSGHEPNIPLLFTFEPISSKIEIDSVSGVEYSRYSLVYFTSLGKKKLFLNRPETRQRVEWHPSDWRGFAPQRQAAGTLWFVTRETRDHEESNVSNFK